VSPNGFWPEIEIEFPAKPEYVRPVRLTVGGMVRMLEASDELVEDVKLAVSEVCTTAVLGGGAIGTPIKLRATANGERMVLEITDPGSGVQRALSGRPTELDTEDLPFDRALALPIIRGLVDELSIRPYEEGGATVRIVVSIPPPTG
jgi:serine/threonine-protein kinase RsbW